MDGNERRLKIIELLKSTDEAISASKLAKSFGVSRQIIVGDIALLRARGESIIASSKGYTFNPYSEGMAFIVAVSHSNDRTKEEIQLFIDNDVTLVNVIVSHPIYGELVGNLNIKTQNDLQDFLNLDGTLLSTLTDGVHLHTILCRDEEHFKDVKKALKENNLLYEN